MKYAVTNKMHGQSETVEADTSEAAINKAARIMHGLGDNATVTPAMQRAYAVAKA